MDIETEAVRHELNLAIANALGKKSGNWASSIQQAAKLPLRDGDRLDISVVCDLVTVSYRRINEKTGYSDTLSIVKRHFSGSVETALAACISLAWAEYWIME